MAHEEIKKAGGVDMGKVYDEFAEKFAEADKLPTWVWVGKPAMKKLLGGVLGNKNARFLDLGSASARLEHWLREEGVPAENMTGIEISPEQVELAKQRIPEANFRVGDITTAPLEPEAYDVVFSHMVFEHLDDAQLLSTCKNAYKALKPGGTFAFVVTHPDKMTNLDGSLVENDGPFITTAPWGGELTNYKRSVEKTKEIVEAAGFRVELMEEAGFPEEAKTADPVSYAKYERYGSRVRLLVKAEKPA